MSYYGIDNINTCDKCGCNNLQPHFNKLKICDIHNTYNEYVDYVRCFKCKNNIVITENNFQCDSCIKLKNDDEKEQALREKYRYSFEKLNIKFNDLRYIIDNYNEFDDYIRFYNFSHVENDNVYSFDCENRLWASTNNISIDNDSEHILNNNYIIISKMCLESYPCQHYVYSNLILQNGCYNMKNILKFATDNNVKIIDVYGTQFVKYHL